MFIHDSDSHEAKVWKAYSLPNLGHVGIAVPGQTRIVLSLFAGRCVFLYCVMRAYLRLVVICPSLLVCPGARVLIDVPCWRCFVETRAHSERGCWLRDACVVVFLVDNVNFVIWQRSFKSQSQREH